MLQGTRLDYFVPGYTGHISCVTKDRFVSLPKEKPRYEIPGYAGYVKSVIPENIHAKTYGKITYNISSQSYVKGQDLAPQHKYISTNSDTFIQPSNMLQRTAADIVGVPRTNIRIKEPPLNPSPIKTKEEIDQFSTTRNWPKIQKKQATGTHDQLIQKDGQPLPGYTGFNRRVFAGNIFGQTYANSRSTARKDLQKIQDTMKRTFMQGMTSHPKIKP